MNHKISIIVPVYNGDKTLSNCLDSIINQTYSNIEVIIINDGSNDGSTEICEEYTKRDPRIHAYDHSHLGISRSRNIGVKRASGDYIQFVDSDDWMEPNMCSTLIENICTSKSQMVVCNYCEVFDDKINPSKERGVGTFSDEEYIKLLMEDPKDYYYGVLWNKLYVREIIIKNRITFREDMIHGEDFGFNLQYQTYINQVAIIPNYLYYYNKSGDGSLDRMKKNCYTRVDNRTKMFLQYRNFFLRKKWYEKYKDEVEYYILDFVINEYRQILLHEKKMNIINKIKCLRYINVECLYKFDSGGIKAYLYIFKNIITRSLQYKKLSKERV